MKTHGRSRRSSWFVSMLLKCGLVLLLIGVLIRGVEPHDSQGRVTSMAITAGMTLTWLAGAIWAMTLIRDARLFLGSTVLMLLGGILAMYGYAIGVFLVVPCNNFEKPLSGSCAWPARLITGGASVAFAGLLVLAGKATRSAVSKCMQTKREHGHL